MISPHLRFGTISTREAVRFAKSTKGEGANTWLSELIWRDFFQMILHHFPHVETTAFIEKYRNIKWPGKRSHFIAWCKGKTGYPIVDAAMQHFNKTGWMHNRLRMIVASFLVKDLLINWQWGEKYFAKYLLDYELASNNGNWQWCASTGVDAQPYFRIFNPIVQSKRFDPKGTFIHENLPEIKIDNVKKIHMPVNPIVEHRVQSNRAKNLFQKKRNI